MAKGTTVKELQSARKMHGLTMDEAGARIVIDGEPTSRGTWHGWESGKKIPKPAAMFELERVFGVQPNAFYPRPDAGGILRASAASQAALAL